MIVDVLEQGRSYSLGPAWEEAMGFLASLSADARDDVYHLKGDDVYARVMTYQSRAREDAVLEAHRVYVDIQMVLSGAERVEWYPAAGLAVREPYVLNKDVVFFFPTAAVPGQVVLEPGLFAVFFPQDAHQPSLYAGGQEQTVKKVVVKIRKELFSRA